MTVLSLKVLGALEFTDDDQPITTHFRSDKVRALLVYLALESERPHQRRSLATLLWPDFSEQDSLRNLRKALFHLRETLEQVAPQASQSLLTVDRQTVQFNRLDFTVDAVQFEQLLAEVKKHGHRHLQHCPACLDRLVKAETLFRGELLPGFGVAEAIDFEEWLLFKREQLQQAAILMLQNLAIIYEQQKDYERTEKVVTRLTLLDPYHEKAVRQLMRVFSHTDRRSAALQIYSRLADRLQSEIGVAPEAKTSQLYQQIMAGEAFEPVQSAGRLHHFPTQFALFLGRKEELAQVGELLLGEECRLVTVMGAGGMGKTRLAIEAAQQAAESVGFADGLYFVPLSAVAGGDDLLTAVATALSLLPRANAPLLTQILDFLQAKHCLLVLDNFEQLVGEAVLLTDILAHAPHVQLLVTSRFALNVRAEQRVSLSGLALPQTDASEEDVAANSSVRLFVESARRVSPGFRLTEENQSAVIQICHLVVGIPLALEIAGAWTRLMSEAAIAAEIQQNIDFLATPMKDLPERHRSMTAVFAYTWNLLSPSEQMALAQLSVFRGGFGMQTAVLITGASLGILGNLLDYSLLQQTANGRYEMHELTRQFAQQQLTTLANGSELEQQSRLRHSEYYLGYLAASWSDLHGATPHLTVSAIQQRWQNIYHAWHWAVSQQQVALLNKSIDALGYFCVMAGMVREGANLFSEASQQLQSKLEMTTAMATELVGRMQIWHGNFLHRQGLVNEALTAVQAVQSFADENNLLDLLMRAQRLLVSIKELQGDYKTTQTILQELIAYYETTGEKQPLADAYGSMGYLFWRRSLYDEAIRHLEKGLELQRQLENVVGQARQINILGLVYRQQGNLTEADSCFSQALVINQAMGHQDGISKNLANLSIVLRQQGKFEQALGINLQAEQAFLKLGHKEGIALLAGNRGIIHQSIGNLEEAAACFALALQLDEALGNQAGVARHLGNIGYMCQFQNEVEQAMSCYDRAIPILRELESAYFLSTPLLHKAELMIKQSDYEAAYGLAAEGLQLAQQVKREDNIALGHIVLAQIEYAQGRVELAQQRLQERLSLTKKEELAASFHYELWRMGAGANHAAKAATLYQKIYGRMPDNEYKIRLKELEAAGNGTGSVVWDLNKIKK